MQFFKSEVIMSKKLKILITSAVVVLAVAVIYVALNSQALSMKRYLRDSSNISIELTTPSYNDRKQVLGDTLEYTDLKTTEEDSAFRDAFDSIFGIMNKHYRRTVC